MRGFLCCWLLKGQKGRHSPEQEKSRQPAFLLVRLPHFHSWGITFLHSHPFSQQPIRMLSPYSLPLRPNRNPTIQKTVYKLTNTLLWGRASYYFVMSMIFAFSEDRKLNFLKKRRISNVEFQTVTVNKEAIWRDFKGISQLLNWETTYLGPIPPTGNPWENLLYQRDEF